MDLWTVAQFLLMIVALVAWIHWRRLDRVPLAERLVGLLFEFSARVNAFAWAAHDAVDTYRHRKVIHARTNVSELSMREQERAA